MNIFKKPVVKATAIVTLAATWLTGCHSGANSAQKPDEANLAQADAPLKEQEYLESLKNSQRNIKEAVRDISKNVKELEEAKPSALLYDAIFRAGGITESERLVEVKRLLATYPITQRDTVYSANGMERDMLWDLGMAAGLSRHRGEPSEAFLASVARLLIAKGFDPNFPTSEGQPAFFGALSSGGSSVAVLKAMLPKVADVNLADREGNGGLHYLFTDWYEMTEQDAKNTVACAKELVRRGADLGLANAKGETARELMGVMITDQKNIEISKANYAAPWKEASEKARKEGSEISFVAEWERAKKVVAVLEALPAGLEQLSRDAEKTGNRQR